MPALTALPARAALSAALLVVVASAAACSGSSSTSGPGLDPGADGGTNDPRSDGGGDGGPMNAGNDPCLKNAWAMPAGCRGGELRTHVLAPKSPKVAWTTPLPSELRLFVGGVVDGAGRIYFILGGSDEGFSAPRRALYRADPESKQATLVRELTASHTSLDGMAIDSAGSILLVDGGKALALDPSDGKTRWELAVGTGAAADEPGAVVVEADGGLHALTSRDYKAFDGARKVRWTRPTTGVGASYGRPIIDPEGRSFAIAGGLSVGFVGLDRNGAELFSKPLDTDPGGWTASATDGQLLYGYRYVRAVSTIGSLGAIDNAKARVEWEEPMQSAVSNGSPIAVAESVLGVTVLGPGSVVFRTSQRLLAKRDGKTAWDVKLDAGDNFTSAQHALLFSDREQTVVVDTATGLAGYDKNGKKTFAADTGAIFRLFPARDGAVWTVSGTIGMVKLSFVSDD